MASTLSLTHRSDGVAVLTMDAPNSRANVLSEAVWAELRGMLLPLRMRSDVKGLVIASAKPDIFIAGADLHFFGNLPRPEDPTAHNLVRRGHSTLGMLESLPFPKCAAINGVALGGGMEVALACDLRVCGSNPRVELGLPEIKLGLIPGWGGTQRLLRIADLATATEMLLLGRSLTAAEAVEAKLVDAVFPNGDLIEHAARYLRTASVEPVRWAKQEPLPLVEQELLKEAIRSTLVPESPAVLELKAVMVRGAEQPLSEALLIESAAFLRLAGSDESKGRIAEFFASRKKS